MVSKRTLRNSGPLHVHEPLQQPFFYSYSSLLVQQVVTPAVQSPTTWQRLPLQAVQVFGMILKSCVRLHSDTLHQ